MFWLIFGFDHVFLLRFLWERRKYQIPMVTVATGNRCKNSTLVQQCYFFFWNALWNLICLWTYFSRNWGRMEGVWFIFRLLSGQNPEFSEDSGCSISRITEAMFIHLLDWSVLERNLSRVFLVLQIFVLGDSLWKFMSNRASAGNYVIENCVTRKEKKIVLFVWTALESHCRQTNEDVSPLL